MRDPLALFNTHMRKAKVLYSEDIGALKCARKDADLRFTSDDHGETFSVTLGNIQIAMNYKDIENLVNETRKDRKRNVN